MKRLLAAFALLVALFVVPAKACDTALILLMDRSGSMSPEEFNLQLQGTADALRSPEVIRRIMRSDGRGSIYVRVGTFDQRTDWHTPWTRIASPGDAEGLAAAVSGIRRLGRSGTDTGMAIMSAMNQFQTLPTPCDRQVIDVSTDGKADDLAVLVEARAMADEHEIIINAAAMALPDPAEDERHSYAPQIPQDELISWAQEHLITGTGSFALAASFQTYAQAMRAKLTMELAAVQSMTPTMAWPGPQSF